MPSMVYEDFCRVQVLALIGERSPGTVRRCQNCGACRASEGPRSLGAVSVASV